MTDIEKSYETKHKLFIVIGLILIVASSIGNTAYHLSKEFQELRFENELYQNQLDSVYKTLAHREQMSRICADRYYFLGYQL